MSMKSLPTTSEKKTAVKKLPKAPLQDTKRLRDIIPNPGALKPCKSEAENSSMLGFRV